MSNAFHISYVLRGSIVVSGDSPDDAVNSFTGQYLDPSDDGQHVREMVARAAIEQNNLEITTVEYDPLQSLECQS